MADSKQKCLIWKSGFKTPPFFALVSEVTKKTSENINLSFVFVRIQEMDRFIAFQHNVRN